MKGERERGGHRNSKMPIQNVNQPIRLEKEENERGAHDRQRERGRGFSFGHCLGSVTVGTAYFCVHRLGKGQFFSL